MNFLKHSSRAIAAYQHSLYPSNRYPFLLLPINRFSLYSTSYHLNAPQITKIPRTRKTIEPPYGPYPSSSPSTSSRKIDVFQPPPRPDETPYQAKDANLVNLIGHIKLPFIFNRSSEDGRYRTITFISQEFGENVFSIPILFEDDLAKVASFHLKLDDFVHVKGQLSEDSIPFDLSEKQSNYHLVVQDIKFVAGFRKKTVEGDVFPDGVDDGLLARNQFGISAADVDETVRDRSKESIIESAKSSRTMNDGKSEECIIDTQKGFHTKKDRESDSDSSWQDLVKNSKQWLDFRDRKSQGSLTPKFPDFKHKDAGTALWLTSAPEWVLTMLGNLEFCVNVPKKNTGSKHNKDEVWKTLVENPSLWWDNRLVKKNVKGPDFVHKETREALWLNSAPDWVVSKLPPLSQKQSADAL